MKITLEVLVYVKWQGFNPYNPKSVISKTVFLRQLRSQFPILSTRKEGNCGVLGLVLLAVVDMDTNISATFIITNIFAASDCKYFGELYIMNVVPFQ